MKTKSSAVIFWVLLSGFTTNVNAQANVKLSNLSPPTSVNADLLPNATNARNIGSYPSGWKSLYLTQRVYMNGTSFLHTLGGEGNTFVGKGAGISISLTGIRNTAIGDRALYFTSTGSRNTATGYLAMVYNTSGTDNMANGTFALYNNTIGILNTAGGTFTLFQNKNGSFNTGLGGYALYDNSSGSNNTAVGSYAGLHYNNTQSTFLGSSAGASSNVTNATAIGYGARVAGSNSVRVGNTAVISIGGYASWTKFSDGRYKKDIKEEVPGLAFINQLRPVVYTVDVEQVDQILNKDMPAIKDQESNIAGREATVEEMAFKATLAAYVHTGFVAQEVEAIAKKLNYNFSGVDAPKNEKDFYGLRYAEFVVPLVKAVQELSQENTELKARLAKVETALSLQTEKNTSVELKNAKLEQNIPNPFNSTTTIRYYLPVNSTNAYINFYSSNGMLLKSIRLEGGKGTITVKTSELPAGVYQYKLIVDSKIIGTKQMMAVR